jgi:hypothetical protein
MVKAASFRAIPRHSAPFWAILCHFPEKEKRAQRYAGQ